MKKLIFALLFLPVSALAASLTATWTNPTKAVDGTNLTGAQALTSVEVFVATSPIADTATTPTATLTGTPTTTTQTVSAAVGATVYVRVRACNQWGCSALSNQVSKVIPGSEPGVPTSVTITLSLT